MIKYASTVRPSAADGLVAEVYRQIRRDFGAVAGPLRLHSAAPELLAGAWCACRETLVAGNVPRERKETVAAMVSEINRCPWCIDAHTTMLRAGGYGSVAPAGWPGDPQLLAALAWSSLAAARRVGQWSDLPVA